jgi:nucleoside-diphosphate-sugar epimerase
VRALLTGASSFTGTWIATALAEAGFEVRAVHRRPLAAYPPLPRRRLERLRGRVELVELAAPAGPEAAALVAAWRPDLLCLHGAEVGDHRSPRFDVVDALARSCAGLGPLLDRFARAGGRAVLATGSIFEADEGRGAPPLRAFNPYGLAKTLAWQTIRFEAERRGLTLGKLTIAHPVGPLDKPGLVADLLGAWRRGEAATVRRPQLVRDFVAVDALASAHARTARRLLEEGRPLRLVPSLWPEPVGAFVGRLAAALRPRLGLACAVRLADPPEPTDEPTVRVGLDPIAELVPDWDEARFWDAVAGEARADEDESKISSLSINS